jgi:polysaccharide biosynthesis protein PslH
MISDTQRPSPTRRRRRVLVCAPLPLRLDARHGLKATSQLLLRLAERNEVALLCLRPPDQEGVDSAVAACCTHVEEIPARLPANPFARRLVWGAGMLRGLPPWATDCRSVEYASALERLLATWRPDVVEVHLQAMAQYVDAPARRNLPVILVDHDPPSVWARDLLETTNGPQRLARRLEVAVWERYERATRHRFDAIVLFTERDLAPAGRTARGASLVRIPLAVEVPPRPSDPRGSDPPTILFVGAFNHLPNIDAALRLGEKIFPRVLARAPEARLALVGHEPEDEVRALARGAVSVHASVPDVTPYLEQAAIVVAPIRLGGGMRLKVLEALAAGKAVVASSLAAEGIAAHAGEHFLLADDDDDLIEALIALLRNPRRRVELGRGARAWAEQNLGLERPLASFEQLYETVIAFRERRL